MSSGRRCLLIGDGGALSTRVAAELGALPDLGDVRLHRGPLPPAASADVDAWIYLAACRGSEPGLPFLADAVRVLDLWRASAVPTLVVAASAAVHEPNAHQPGLAVESSPPLRRTGNRVADAWWRLEEELARADRDPARALCRLRTAITPVPGEHDPFSRMLSSPIAWTLPGYDPPIQLLAVEDLAAAIAAAVCRGARGTFHVAPSGVVGLHRALDLAGVRAAPVPHLVQRAGRALEGQIAGSESPAWLDYLRYSWTVDGSRARTRLGFTPRWSSAAVAAGFGSGDATAAPDRGAAGADDDEWGMDHDTIDRLGCTLFRFLHDHYWRVETAGLDTVPRRGAAVLAGVHRGFMPFDAIMALHVLATRTGRYPRFLIHPGLIKFPFLHDFFFRLGGVLACRQNACRLLGRGEMVAILPEGVHGAFSLYRDAYRMDTFRRRDYVRLALEHRAPILPFVTVGSAETLPLIARIRSRRWRRFAEWPYLPVCATLLPLPLPARWHTLFLEPQATDHYPDGAHRDEALVAALHARIRDRLAEAMQRIRERRPSVFYGSVFGSDERG